MEDAFENHDNKPIEVAFELKDLIWWENFGERFQMILNKADFKSTNITVKLI